MCIWEVPINKRHCTLCKVRDCESRQYIGKRGGNVMPTVRNLEVNESCRFSIAKYNAIRSAIYYAKKDYEMICTFRRDHDEIIVTRIK